MRSLYLPFPMQQANAAVLPPFEPTEPVCSNSPTSEAETEFSGKADPAHATKHCSLKTSWEQTDRRSRKAIHLPREPTVYFCPAPNAIQSLDDLEIRFSRNLIRSIKRLRKRLRRTRRKGPRKKALLRLMGLTTCLDGDWTALFQSWGFQSVLDFAGRPSQNPYPMERISKWNRRRTRLSTAADPLAPSQGAGEPHYTGKQKGRGPSNRREEGVSLDRAHPLLATVGQGGRDEFDGNPFDWDGHKVDQYKSLIMGTSGTLRGEPAVAFPRSLSLRVQAAVNGALSLFPSVPPAAPSRDEDEDGGTDESDEEGDAAGEDEDHSGPGGFDSAVQRSRGQEAGRTRTRAQAVATSSDRTRINCRTGFWLTPLQIRGDGRCVLYAIIMALESAERCRVNPANYCVPTHPTTRHAAILATRVLAFMEGNKDVVKMHLERFYLSAAAVVPHAPDSELLQTTCDMTFDSLTTDLEEIKNGGDKDQVSGVEIRPFLAVFSLYSGCDVVQLNMVGAAPSRVLVYESPTSPWPHEGQTKGINVLFVATTGSLMSGERGPRPADNEAQLEGVHVFTLARAPTALLTNGQISWKTDGQAFLWPDMAPGPLGSGRRLGVFSDGFSLPQGSDAPGAQGRKDAPKSLTAGLWPPRPRGRPPGRPATSTTSEQASAGARQGAAPAPNTPGPLSQLTDSGPPAAPPVQRWQSDEDLGQVQRLYEAHVRGLSDQASSHPAQRLRDHLPLTSLVELLSNVGVHQCLVSLQKDVSRLSRISQIPRRRDYSQVTQSCIDYQTLFMIDLLTLLSCPSVPDAALMPAQRTAFRRTYESAQIIYVLLFDVLVNRAPPRPVTPGRATTSPLARVPPWRNGKDVIRLLYTGGPEGFTSLINELGAPVTTGDGDVGSNVRPKSNMSSAELARSTTHFPLSLAVAGENGSTNDKVNRAWPRVSKLFAHGQLSRACAALDRACTTGPDGALDRLTPEQTKEKLKGFHPKRFDGPPAPNTGSQAPSASATGAPPASPTTPPAVVEDPTQRPDDLWDKVLDDGATVRATAERLGPSGADLFTEEKCPDSLILDVLKRLSPATHPGPFSPPAEFFQLALRIGAAAPWAGRRALCMYVRRILTDTCPVSPWDVLTHSTLIPIPKGAEAIRPIACPAVFYKLVMQVALRKLLPRILTALGPLQKGAATPLGVDSVIRHIEHCLEARPDLVFFALDLANAFNSISRVAILESVRELVPELFPLVAATLATPSPLHLSGRAVDPSDPTPFLWSVEGVRQGDPTSPALFCLGIASVLRMLAERTTGNAALGGGLLLGFMDDVSGCAPPATVERIFKEVVPMMGAINLKVQLRKCHTYVPPAAMEPRTEGPPVVPDMHLPFGVTTSTKGGTVLGTAVGNADYVSKFLSQKRTASVDGILKGLRYVGASQPNLAVTLLRSCVSTRWSHMPRNLDPGRREVMEALEGFDGAMRDTLRAIYSDGGQTLPAQIVEAYAVAPPGDRLGRHPHAIVARGSAGYADSAMLAPASCGGLDFTSLVVIAKAAHTACLLQTLPSLVASCAEESLNRYFACPPPAPPARGPLTPPSAPSLSTLLESRHVSSFLSQINWRSWRSTAHREADDNDNSSPLLWDVATVVERSPRDLQHKLAMVAHRRDVEDKVRALHNAALTLETRKAAVALYRAGKLSYTYLYGLFLHSCGKGQGAITHPGFMVDRYRRPRIGNIYTMVDGPQLPSPYRTMVQVRLAEPTGALVALSLGDKRCESTADLVPCMGPHCGGRANVKHPPVHGPFGLHAATCRYGPHCHRRHNSARDCTAKVARKITGVFVDTEALPRTDRIEAELSGILDLQGWVTPMPGPRDARGLATPLKDNDGRRIDVIIRGLEGQDAALLLGTGHVLASVSTLIALNKAPPPATKGQPKARHYVSASDLSALPGRVDVAVDVTFSHFAAHLASLPFKGERGSGLPAGPSDALTDLVSDAKWESGLHSVERKEKYYADVLNAATHPTILIVAHSSTLGRHSARAAMLYEGLATLAARGEQAEEAAGGPRADADLAERKRRLLYSLATAALRQWVAGMHASAGLAGEGGHLGNPRGRPGPPSALPLNSNPSTPSSTAPNTPLNSHHSHDTDPAGPGPGPDGPAPASAPAPAPGDRTQGVLTRAAWKQLNDSASGNAPGSQAISLPSSDPLRPLSSSSRNPPTLPTQGNAARGVVPPGTHSAQSSAPPPPPSPPGKGLRGLRGPARNPPHSPTLSPSLLSQLGTVPKPDKHSRPTPGYALRSKAGTSPDTPPPPGRSEKPSGVEGTVRRSLRLSKSTAPRPDTSVHGAVSRAKGQ